MNDQPTSRLASIARFIDARIGKGRNVVLLSLLCLFLLANNILWFNAGASPQHWDSAVHLFESLNAHRIGGDPSTPLFRQILNVSWYYPPLVSYTSIPFYAVFGESEFSGMLVMTFFLLLFAVSVYGIGASLYTPRAGLLAAASISFFPVVIDFSRTFMLDLPLSSLVVLSVYLLLRTKSFSQFIPSLLLGVALGAGMLTKWTFPVFLIGPFLYTTYQAFKNGPGRLTAVRNISTAILAGMFLMAPWYIAHIVQILSGRSGELGRGENTVIQSIFYYFSILPEQASWLGVLFICIGIAVYFRKYSSSHTFLLVWFASGYFFLTLIGFKLPRFSIALLAPLVLMTGAGFEKLNFDSPRRGRRLYAAAVLALLLQYLIFTYVPSASALGIQLSKTGIVQVAGPAGSNWMHAEILEAIDKDFESKDRKAVVRIVPDYIYFNVKTFEYDAALHRFPVVVSGTSGFPLFTDYVVIKTGEVGDDPVERRREKLQAVLLSDTLNAASLYDVLRTFALPDGSQAIVLRVTPKAVRNISSNAVVKELRACSDKFVRRFVRPVDGYGIGIEEYSADKTLQGKIKSLRLSLAKGDIGDYAFSSVGIPTSTIAFELDDITFDPTTLMTKDTLQILSIKRLSIDSIAMTASDIKNYIERSSKGKTAVEHLSFSNGILALAIRQEKTNSRVRVAMRIFSVGGRNVYFEVTELRYGSIPVPAFIVNALTASFNPLLRGLDVLSEVHIGTITLNNDQLCIGDGKD